MKTLKHLFTALLLMVATVVSAHDFMVNGIYYNITSGTKKTVEVTYSGSSYSSVSNEYIGSVDIPAVVTHNNVTYSVTSIGHEAFYECPGLTSVTIGNSVTSIGANAFTCCIKLASIEIPNSIIGIGEQAFSDCSGLISIVVEEGNIVYDSRNNCNAIIETKTNTLVVGCKNTIIPNSVTSIEEWAFSGCAGLTSIEIPSSVTSIGDYAFYNCIGLTNVTIPNSVTSIEEWAFSGCAGLTSIIIPNSVTSIEEWAFSGCAGLTSIVIPNSVKTIGPHAFINCTSLTNIEIPNGIIYSNAFQNCTGLTSVTIGSDVSSIKVGAFTRCTGLANIVVEEGNIVYDSRNNCNAIIETETNTLVLGCKNTIIPNSVTSIGEGAFDNCTGLTSITIPNSVTSIGDYAFSGCSGLASITIPSSVTSIGSYAFYDCSGLTSIEIPNNVTSIGDYAFLFCIGLTNATIPNSVTSIGNGVFAVCASLTSVTIPNSVTSIGEVAFMECLSLSTIEIPNSVTAIGNEAFTACGNLHNVTIGSGVKNIGYGAFSDCYCISKIVSRAKMPPLCDLDVFNNIDNWECVLWVPVGSKQKYQVAEQWKDFVNIEEFNIEIYKVTFIVDSEVYDTLSVECGEKITLPETPVKEGHTFSGWSEVPETMPAEDITITGSFEVNTYAVTYIVDGEVYATDSVAYGSEIVLRDEPAKEGHTFSGWSEAPATMPAEDITITGSFEVNTYAVTYIVDGEVYATDSVAYGSEIVLRDEPAKEGHTFSGWSEAPATMPAEDITITGSFEVNTYAVTYIVDGEVYATDSVAYGSEIVLRDEPAKEGHTFSGWSDVPETMPAEDITVEGTFSINSYTVTFIIDGEVYETATVEFGAKIELSTPPEKEGYIFSGWVGVPDTMPAEDIVIEGEYIVDTTGINDVKAENGKVKGVYDLQGRKVDNATNGIYIINGKKTLIK